MTAQMPAAGWPRTSFLASLYTPAALATSCVPCFGSPPPQCPPSIKHCKHKTMLLLVSAAQVLTEVAGTMGYMAPELMKRCYTEAADVWSAGVMLYEMIAGQLPFSLGNTVEEVRTGRARLGCWLRQLQSWGLGGWRLEWQLEEGVLIVGPGQPSLWQQQLCTVLLRCSMRVLACRTAPPPKKPSRACTDVAATLLLSV